MKVRDLETLLQTAKKTNQVVFESMVAPETTDASYSIDRVENRQGFFVLVSDEEEKTGLQSRLQWLINWLDKEGYLEDHCFTFPDGETWSADES